MPGSLVALALAAGLAAIALLDGANKSRSLFPINTDAFFVGGIGLGAGAVLLLATRARAPKTTAFGGVMKARSGALALRSSF